ncbi:sucrose synthase [Trifolium repens]|nr:sucrose synthase [Trifolium repens]
MLLCIKQQGLDIVPRLLIITRLHPMQSVLLMAKGLRRSTELNIATFFEFPLVIRRDLFASGSHDSKSGHLKKTYIEDVLISLPKSCVANQI